MSKASLGHDITEISVLEKETKMMHMNSNEPHIPGTHISAVGPYQQTIARLANKYPNLRYKDYKLIAPQRKYASPSRVAAIGFESTPQPKAQFTDLHNLLDLQPYLGQDASFRTGVKPQRRLFIMEGLDPEYVSLFGTALDIDPNFFMRHQRTPIWERLHKAGNTPRLPSFLNVNKSFVLEYPELRHLDESRWDYRIRCAENERHIGISRRDGRFDGIGAIQRKVSFWARERPQGGWDALMLVDEPLKRVLEGDRTQQEVVEVTSEPFQGGYYDFIKYDTLAEATRTDGPPRTSMFDDLCYYFQKHIDVVELGSDPRCLTVIPEKIMASQYMLLIQYYCSHLSHLEWVLSRRENFAALDIKWVEERWSDLLSLHRRLGEQRTRVNHIIMRLAWAWASPRSADWLESKPDFEHILSRLEMLEHQVETLLASFTGLAGIVGNRQSLFEARTVRLLTGLGMTFLPLSLTSGIFSMAFPYAPGNDQFWIYFAVAIPLVLIVFTIPFVVSRWHDRNLLVDSKMKRSKRLFQDNTTSGHMWSLSAFNQDPRPEEA